LSCILALFALFLKLKRKIIDLELFLLKFN
jgi:hypothetical protein